jgi:uncharacterized membrane protein SpoIIM required for sporulation
MKETQFLELRSEDWARWDAWLRSKRSGKELPFPSAEFPHRYRELCRDLSLARDRNYSSPLVERLHDRVLQVQQRVYGPQPGVRNAVLHFLVAGFPALVRREWRFVLPAVALFLLPLFMYLAAAQRWPESVYLVMPTAQAAQVEEMYSPDAPRLGRLKRDAGDDFTMLGFYIWNNVRIDFQCFAGGLFFGLGAVFYLLFNGLFIGAIAGHLTQLGYIETFWGFVAGHSAFELTGAMLSGAAGLRMGYALVAPGSRRRSVALREAAAVAVRLLYGAAALTFCAAFVEAFWSPLRSVPVTLKYGIGIVLWILLLAYFAFAGRGVRHEERHAA